MYVGGILLSVAIAIIVVYLIRATKSLAPWIPSKTSMADQAFRFIKPAPGSRLIDLGCGDGRIVIHAAKRYGIVATGIEISPLPYLLAKLRQIAHLNLPISIRYGDLYTIPLDRYDMIYIYGLPGTLRERLEPKLSREVRPGTWVISYNFSIGSKKPLMEFHEQWRNCYIYRY